MITSNVITRILHVRYDGKAGTAFAIDRNQKQYVITARHVVKGIETGNVIEVFHEKVWKKIAVDVVGLGSDGIDLTVLACPVQVAPPYPLEASIAGLGYGQQVYFLGFPFGWDSGTEGINEGMPVPFVKTGVVSAIFPGNASRFYIDGHGNKGFSGGPVVFVPNGRPANEFHVAGVVAEAPRPQLEAVVDRFGQPILKEDGQPMSYIAENQGFVVAYTIVHATNLIDRNPIGFKLPAGQSK